MDSQHTRKVSTLEKGENHGVQVCSKCGWHFPNSHPSAKHRRAHRKICGSIEGYNKSVNSAESSLHLSVADEGRFSDDDLKTPSPKIVKHTKTELGTSGGSIGGESNRSGYEVFLDADTDFSDSAAPSQRLEEHAAGSKDSVSDLGKSGKEGFITLLDKESEATVSTDVPKDLASCLSRSIESKDDVKGDVKKSEETVLETSTGENSLEEPGPALSHTPTDPEIESDLHATNYLDRTSGDTIEGHDIKGEGNSRHLNPVDGMPEIVVGGLESHKALNDESSELMFELIPIEKGTGILDAKVNTDEKLSSDELNPENEETLKVSPTEEQASRYSVMVNTDTDSLVSLLEAEEEVMSEASDIVEKGNVAADHDKVEMHVTGMAGSHSESQGADNVRMDDMVVLTDTMSTHLNEVSNTNLVGEEARHSIETHSNSQDSYNEDLLDNETNRVTKVTLQCEGSPVANSTDLNHSCAVEFSEKTTDNQILEEPLLSLVQSFDSVDDERARALNGSLQEQGDQSCSKQQLGVQAPDVLVDSHSQTDSVEANWGSVSDATGLSTRSDALAIVDAEEDIPSTDSQTSTLPQKVNSLDKPDSFEKPTFMTTAEPSEAPASEIQSLQGRKKNEEVIDKVNNWTTLKQRNPLKSFLGESYAETKQKTSSNPIPTPQNDNKSVTTVNAILGSEPPDVQVMSAETSKEWNSSARYPAEIKTERRKAKGKPYWVPFVCCSSAN